MWSRYSKVAPALTNLGGGWPLHTTRLPDLIGATVELEIENARPSCATVFARHFDLEICPTHVLSANVQSKSLQIHPSLGCLEAIGLFDPLSEELHRLRRYA